MRYIQNFFAGALAGALSSVVLAQGALVKIDGSSTVYPVTEAVAEEFQKAEKNAIKVTISGPTHPRTVSVGMGRTSRARMRSSRWSAERSGPAATARVVDTVLLGSSCDRIVAVSD